MNNNFDDEMEDLQDMIDGIKQALKVLAWLAFGVAILAAVTL